MNPVGSFTPPGTLNQDTGLGWEYLRLINCSPYQLQVSLGGQGSKIHPEMFFEDIPLTRAFNGKVVVTAVAQMSAGSISNALTNYVQLEVYGPGEIRQPQAQPLTTLAAVGGGFLSQATSVVQTGQPIPTAVLSGTPSASFIGLTEESLINNDGSAHFGQISAHLFVSWDNNGNENVQSLTEFGGGIKGSAPVKLTTGNQETGYCSGLQNNVNNTGTTGGPANFKTTMTNIPSSITVTVASSSNAPAPTAGNITLYGFSLFWTPTAAGTQSFVEGTYVTVGN